MPLGDGVTWDETTPVDGTIGVYIDDYIRHFGVGVRLRMANEHEWPSSQSTEAEAGMHKFMTLQAQVVKPTLSGSQIGAVYSKSGTLYYEDPAGAEHLLYVQRQITQSAVAGSGTTLMVLDSSIPQITEGNEVITCAITPKNTGNYLEIEAVVNFSLESGAYGVIALFQDATANAICATAFAGVTSSGIQTVVLKYRMLAGTTSATTFRIRIGRTTSGTIYWNQTGAGGYTLGGVLYSSLRVNEITV